MSTFVESLKRLYEQGKITTDRLAELQTTGKITADEYEYITAEASQPSNDSDLQAFYDAVTQEVGV